MSSTPFTPGLTYALSCSGTSTSQDLVSKSDGQTLQVRVASASGNAPVFIKFSAAGTAATASDMPVLGGTVELLSTTSELPYISAICPSTSATLYVTVGWGS